MNALTTERVSRATPMVHETFDLYRIAGGGGLHRSGDLVRLGSFTSAEEAVKAMPMIKGKKLAICRRDVETGETVLHIYLIRQKSKAVYRYNSRGEAVRCHDTYAEHLMDLRPGQEVLPWMP